MLRMLNEIKGSATETITGKSTGNISVEQMWSSFSPNVSGEVMRQFEYFAAQRLLDLGNPVHLLCAQQVALAYVEAKAAHFIHARNCVERGSDGLTVRERYEKGVLKALGDGLVVQTNAADLQAAVAVVTAWNVAQGNQVYGQEAELWGPVSEALCGAGWPFLRPAHLVFLRREVGRFTFPGEGLLEGPSVMLDRFYVALGFMREVWVLHCGSTPSF